MPQYKYNTDIWNVDLTQNNIIFTTTNSVVKSGKLIMGAGNALQAKKRYSNLPDEFGTMILAENKNLNIYGILLFNDWKTTKEHYRKIGAFQTKIVTYQNSYLALIQYSTDLLNLTAIYNLDFNFHLPFPGIGKGNLSENEVKPIIDKLPNNVYIYTL